MRQTVRFDVPSQEMLGRLVAEPLAGGARATAALRSFHRDVYFDTPDAALQARGIEVRFRARADDRRFLTLTIDDATATLPGRRFHARVPDVDAWRALTGASAPARRLRGLVDPAHLEPRVQLETERHVRWTASRWMRAPRVGLVYDAATVRAGGASRTFHDLTLRPVRGGASAVNALASALQRQHGLRPIVATKRERALLVLRWMEHELEARSSTAPRVAVLVAERDGRIACIEDGTTLRLPTADGSGEEAGALFRRTFAADASDLRLIGTVAPRDARPLLEIWRAAVAPAAGGDAATLVWLPLEEAVARAGSPLLRDSVTLAALTVLARETALAARVPSRAAPPPAARADAPGGLAPAGPPAPGQPAVQRLLDGELSQLEFQSRVLSMAEDARTPLLERLRFLSIVSSNLDEFFMTRVSGLKRASPEIMDEDGAAATSPAEQLDAIGARVRVLAARQQRCLESCRAELAASGIRVRSWSDLHEEERAEMRRYFQDHVAPTLTPLALTLGGGHPFPRAPNLTLSLAVMFVEQGRGEHILQLEIPPSLPRFIRVGTGHDHVPTEEVVRANLGRLYSNRDIDQAYLFRVTRGSDLGLAKASAGKLLDSVDAATRHRLSNPAVRLEVERAMPQLLRELLLRELQREGGGGPGSITAADVYDVDGLVGLTDLRELAALPLPELQFPPFVGRSPLPADRPVWDVLREGELLVHHPYEDFAATVLRLLDEAAADPDVLTIRMTLYRAGKRSPVVEALTRAAAAGKDVAVFVELTARFDEERNVKWARHLEEAGVHVVYGVEKHKTHAKVVLVTRRERDRVRRYVHVGTGNYNADTARLYTDLGLLSADDGLGADLNDLFNELTGSSRPPDHPGRRCLIAPYHLLPGLVDRVRREAEHARAGRGGHIRAKLNGLSDGEMIEALYDASQAGVDVDLIVRGICTLRPGVPGLSERIRVVSTVGRFLEHARIYHFANAGRPEYFIGSADWRRRNLRRRVEVAAGVVDARSRARLDELLELELRDPHAWELRPDGSYARRGSAAETTPSAQERLIAEAGTGD